MAANETRARLIKETSLMQERGKVGQEGGHKKKIKHTHIHRAYAGLQPTKSTEINNCPQPHARTHTQKNWSLPPKYH